MKGLTKLLQNNVNLSFYIFLIFFTETLIKIKSLDRVLLISIFRKAISLLHISNPSLQKELLNLLHVVLSTINYDLLEKECEQNALLLSEKSQPKFNKIAAIRLIAHISEVSS